VEIRADDLRGPEIRALLEEHLADMRAISPPGSVHALDLDSLRGPGISFWTAWDGADLLGCGALRVLSADHAEIKSMRTARRHRGRGVGAAILAHALAEARRLGCTRVSLETGSQPEFAPAHRLYERAGFRPCGPFGDYRPDPNSRFYTLTLGPPERA
jgi:putative acetyltransferase